MIVGLDLDNTIVDCDALFRQETEKLLGRSLPTQSREDIRALVRQERGDNVWTQIQAEVYGPLYHNCKPCKDAIETISELMTGNHVTNLMIISHKTLTDSAGKNYKLRDYSMAWIEKHLLNGKSPLQKSHVHFADTIEQKRQMIIEKGCNIFLDDLAEILLPLKGKIQHPILFNQNTTNHPLNDSLKICDWPSFGAFVRRV